MDSTTLSPYASNTLGGLPLQSFLSQNRTEADIYNNHDDTASEEEYELDTSSASSQMSRSSVESDPQRYTFQSNPLKRLKNPVEAQECRNFSSKTAFNVNDDLITSEFARSQSKTRPESARSSSYESDRAADDIYEVLRSLQKDSSPATNMSSASLTESLIQDDARERIDALDKRDGVESFGIGQRHKGFTPSSIKRDGIKQARFRNPGDVEFRKESTRSRSSTPMKPTTSGLSATPTDPFWPTPRSPRYKSRLSNPASGHYDSPRQEKRPQGWRKLSATGSLPIEKEYKLVLLQCAIIQVVLPYSEEVVQNVLPLKLQQDMARLSRVLTRTILDRGLLIAHPGDDYDLLEERILENLGLKLSRIGQCGHFLGPSQDNGEFDHDESSNNDFTLPHPSSHCCTCVDCGQHLANSLDHRRWEIRVYASNGLMSSCAWTAAWRQMETADVEISIHIPEHLREKLEEAQHLLETKPVLCETSQAEEEYMELPFQNSAPFQDPEPFQKRKVDRTIAFEVPSYVKSAPQTSTSSCSSPNGQLPLFTLLIDYVKRRIGHLTTDGRHGRESIFISALAIVVLFLAASSIFVVQTKNSLIADGFVDAGKDSSWIDNTPYTTLSKQVGVNVAQPDRVVSYPACTFPVELAGQYHMTALPEDIASKVLESWSSTFTTESYKQQTAMPTSGVLAKSSNSEDGMSENKASEKGVAESFIDVTASALRSAEELVVGSDD